jgi:hypothetical protein
MYLKTEENEYQLSAPLHCVYKHTVAKLLTLSTVTKLFALNLVKYHINHLQRFQTKVVDVFMRNTFYVMYKFVVV